MVGILNLVRNKKGICFYGQLLHLPFAKKKQFVKGEIIAKAVPDVVRGLYWVMVKGAL